MNLITCDYQGFTITYQDDGWFNATQAAAKWGKEPVIYCIRFKNGLCKVGMTKNLTRRVIELSGHGLWRSMFTEVLAVETGKKQLGTAEATAIKLFSSVAEQRGKEVFVDPGSEVAIEVLRNAVINCVGAIKPNGVTTPTDYARIADETGLWSALEWLAKEKRAAQTEDEAIRFAMDVFDGKSDQEILELLNELHPFCEPLARHLVERNAVLIGRGLSYEQRKVMVGQYAKDWALNVAMGLPGAAMGNRLLT